MFGMLVAISPPLLSSSDSAKGLQSSASSWNPSIGNITSSESEKDWLLVLFRLRPEPSFFDFGERNDEVGSDCAIWEELSRLVLKDPLTKPRPELQKMIKLFISTICNFKHFEPYFAQPCYHVIGKLVCLEINIVVFTFKRVELFSIFENSAKINLFWINKMPADLSAKSAEILVLNKCQL